MDRQVFQQFRELIYRESGIALNDDKVALLSNRIQKRLRALKLSDTVDYLSFLKTDTTGDELIQLLDVISTNVTYFYREAEHFTLLGQTFDQWQAQKRKTVRAWCAAASSGEEPYTIAITAAEHLQLASCDFRMLATDICLKVLGKAQEGLYPQEQLRQTPQPILKKYFSKVQSGDREMWQVDPQLAKHIVFKRLNLSVFPYPLKGPLDVIFCRNVMIYFDLELRKKIIAEFERLLAPGGYLFVSRSETLLGIPHSLKTIAVSVYQKPGQGGRS